MKPEFGGIRLTIIELFGAFLPGLVWLLLGASLSTLWLTNKWQPPLDVLSSAAAGQFAGVVMDKWVFGISVAILATLLGLAIGRSGVIFIMAERAMWLYTLAFFSECPPFPDLSFPYDNYWEARVPGLIQKVSGRLSAALGLPADQKLEPLHRFLGCKYFFRETAPHLWEEVERLEAVVSFLSSLWGASVLAVLMGLVGAITGQTGSAGLLFSILASCALIRGYSDNRRREPYLIYLMFLRVLPPLPEPAPDPGTALTLASENV